MIVNPLSTSTIATRQSLPSQGQRQSTAGTPGISCSTTKVTISQAARDALAICPANSAADPKNTVDSRLAQIKSTDALSRTDEDWSFLFANDKKLAEIEAKPYNSQTAADIDYIQKARGFVNTMGNLNDTEKALYDKLVSKGNMDAAGGISQIAVIRKLDLMAGGSDGTTYDSINTTITAENIQKFFKHSIVDPTGRTEGQLEALAQYLQNGR